MRTIRMIWTAALPGLLVALLVAGCGTTPQRKRVGVEMTRTGGAIIEGVVFGPQQIGTGLRRAGARPATRLEVTLPPDADAASIQAFARTLSSAGYRLVHFRTPKKTSAFVK